VRFLAAERPVRVCLIGAGKFGSMFLSQVPKVPSIVVSDIVDLSPDRARQSCRRVGWDEKRIAEVRFSDDAAKTIRQTEAEVVVEATGHPGAGIAHAEAAFAAGRHVVMVNVEADALAGPLLARRAAEAGVVYGLAYGDQPALICELVEWARTCGFDVVGAGKGTRYLPSFHASTPDTVWKNRGVNPADAQAGGMNPQMFNSFIDGTKSAIEMAAVANATGLSAAENGLTFPPVSIEQLPQILKPAAAGGMLERAGQVEVVSSANRDGSNVPNNIRWGVFVTFTSDNEYTRRCFREYGLATDDTGHYGVLYRPFHLIGLEANVSILSAALRREPTGCASGFRADVVATAKRALKKGEVLDGEGGYMAWGKLMPAAKSIAVGGLPIGLAHGIALAHDVAEGASLTWDDVSVDPTNAAYRFRRERERAFAGA
jgi:predicted homoserine dehydrogenase-like protein